MNRDEAIATLTRKKKPLTQEAFVNAARNGVPHLLLEYLAAGFDPNLPDKDDETVLAAAVTRNDPALVRLLLDNGARADDAALFFSAIWGAAFDDSIEVIDMLYAAGCPIHFLETGSGFDGLALGRDMGNRGVIARLEQIYGSAPRGAPVRIDALVVEKVGQAGGVVVEKAGRHLGSKKWWQFWK